MRRGRGILLLFLLVFAANGLTLAQNSKKEAQLRTVRGMVSNKEDKPLQNAVVFLKNLRTNTVISHYSDQEGNYRFSGLDPNADYEIYAEFGSEKSASRTVSPLDSRRDMTLNLKVDRKKN